MRFLIAGTLLLTSILPAGAAPPSSCAGKFIGEWRHSGSGNRGSIMADGRALCSEHPACTQGTWTCSGNVLTYTNSLGTWDYTLAPDGKSMSTNGGAAVATRIGSAPASARSRDLGTAANVTADILGIDRTPSAAPPPAPPPAAPKPPATPPSAVDGEKRAAANYAHTLYGAGEAALNSARDFTYANRKRELQVAEDNFTKAAEQYRKAGDPAGEAKARRAIAMVRAADAKTPERAPRPDPKPKVSGAKPSKENCERVEDINFTIIKLKWNDPQRADLVEKRNQLRELCK
ncbi:hypothetical protein GA0061098_102951 [Bradyrhizobium shewense]|uniref:Uncharacterized protein n=1 Tax=Bradyrhizobium shewense TaxID=1761772 RepID=A0A1C3XR08_9BRAD|nr:hypothetical protein [Bradyrhizobium shewense]SCB54698.1 hypothetical protein GA0061098_102951 [Bradyrhizobium shewense]